VQSFAPWQQATIEIMLAISFTIACSRYIYNGVIIHAHPVRGESQSTQHHRRGCNNIPSFLQRTTPIARSFCEDWTRHDLYILVTAPFSCDRKSRAACAQSFAPWQQATIEILLAISLLARATCTMVLFFTHILFVVNHTSTQHHRRGCNNYFRD